MSFFRSNKKILTKIRSYKKDIAPVGFYFDIFSTEIFTIPILPIPMRIDKLSNGEPTLFISPNREKLNKVCKKLKLIINFNPFYEIGIENLIKYASIKQSELTFRGLNAEKVRNWWQRSTHLSGANPDLVKSFTYLISQFLKTYSFIDENNLNSIDNNEEYKNSLIEYCESIIKYFQKKIEKNTILIKKEDHYDFEKLYLERKQKYYPLIIKMPIRNLMTDKSLEMGFVPYLIYDDLLDSFYYNKKLLEEGKNNTINLKVYENYKIINKTSTIDDLSTDSSKIEENTLDLEEILLRLKLN